MKPTERGFTLLEVLFSLSLLGILMALVASTLSSSNRTLLLSEQYSNRLTEIRTAQSFMRGALQQTLAMTFLDDADNHPLMFEGQPEQIRFIAPLPTQLAGGAQLHKLYLSENDHGTTDLQASFFQISPQGSAQWGTPQMLLQNVQHLRVSYRGEDNERSATGWLETWPWPQRLPQYVRIELDAEGSIAWPTMVIAIRLSQPDGEIQQ